MEEGRSVFKTLAGKRIGMGALQKNKRRWEDNGS